MASVVALPLAAMALGTLASRSATAPAVPPPLPRLGAAHIVDESDVADPFILAAATAAVGRVSVSRTADPDARVPDSPALIAASPAETYIRFGTTDWRSNVPTAISADLGHWTPVADALPALPTWATPSVAMTWAPAAIGVARHWVLYFTTEDAASGLECIGAATASRPEGPYTDRSAAPLICQTALGGSIDPSILRVHGRLHVLWKNDGNARGVPDSIWEQSLTGDGLRVVGRPVTLLSAGPAWQAGVIEAPAMVATAAGGYWLFYSGGVWTSGAYATGLAYCRSVAGPCTPTAAGPYLPSTAQERSPGGLETFTDRQGRLWAAFSTFVREPSRWRPDRYHNERVLDIAPFLSH